jgi:1-acyl-sn-glycerol-3-phosphate acyltransferase
LTSQPGPSEPGTGRRSRTKAAAPPRATAPVAHPDGRLNGRRAAGSQQLNGGQALTGRSVEIPTGPAPKRTRPVPPGPMAGVKAAAATPSSPKPASAKPGSAKPTPPKPTSPKAPQAQPLTEKPRSKPRISKAPSPLPPAPAEDRTPDVWDDWVADLLAFVRRRLTGQYEVDEFGFDHDLTDNLLYPLLRQIYRHYFRVECTGVENLPDGPALIVGNHSGTLPIDASMLTVAVHDETAKRRHLRLLGADLVFRVPILSELARKSGSTLACNPDAERLLRNGEYVGVFPEGFKGIGKPYRDRYKLQRFGRGGFVSAALRTGAPIVPVSIVGAEEIYPIIGNIRPLARVTGLPYVPITPLFPWLGPLGLLPLPSKWLIEFGKPIDTTQFMDDADDPIVVFNLADQVRETIQQTLHTLLERRPDPFG